MTMHLEAKDVMRIRQAFADTVGTLRYIWHVWWYESDPLNALRVDTLIREARQRQSPPPQSPY